MFKYFNILRPTLLRAAKLLLIGIGKGRAVRETTFPLRMRRVGFEPTNGLMPMEVLCT